MTGAVPGERHAVRSRPWRIKMRSSLPRMTAFHGIALMAIAWLGAASVRAQDDLMAAIATPDRPTKEETP